jgi:putative oxidoreductase
MNPAGQSNMMLVGRVMVSAIFLVFGIRKLIAVAGTAGYFAKLGFPMPDVMVWVAILIVVGGGALLLLGWQTRRVAWLLILFVIIATAMAHRFWELSDPAQYFTQLNNFLKNVGVIGGLLYIAAFGAGSLSMDARARTS